MSRFLSSVLRGKSRPEQTIPSPPRIASAHRGKVTPHKGTTDTKKGNKKGEREVKSSPLPRPVALSAEVPVAVSLRSGILLAEFAEVFDNDFAIAWGHVAGKLTHAGLPILRRQLAPLLRQILDLLRIDLTGTAVIRDVRVLHRAAWPIGSTRRTAGFLTTTGSATTVRSATLLVLKLLDDFVES